MKKSVFITSLFLGISLFDSVYAAQTQTIQQKLADNVSISPSEILQAFKVDPEFFNKLNQDQRNKVFPVLAPFNDPSNIDAKKALYKADNAERARQSAPTPVIAQKMDGKAKVSPDDVKLKITGEKEIKALVNLGLDPHPNKEYSFTEISEASTLKQSFARNVQESVSFINSESKLRKYFAKVSLLTKINKDRIQDITANEILDALQADPKIFYKVGAQDRQSLITRIEAIKVNSGERLVIQKGLDDAKKALEQVDLDPVETKEALLKQNLVNFFSGGRGKNQTLEENYADNYITALKTLDPKIQNALTDFINTNYSENLHTWERPLPKYSLPENLTVNEIDTAIKKISSKSVNENYTLIAQLNQLKEIQTNLRINNAKALNAIQEANLLTTIKANNFKKITVDDILEAYKANPRFFYNLDQSQRQILFDKINRDKSYTNDTREKMLFAAKNALEQMDLEIKDKVHQVKKAHVLSDIDNEIKNIRESRAKLIKAGPGKVEDARGIIKQLDLSPALSDAHKRTFPRQYFDINNPLHKALNDNIIHQFQLNDFDEQEKLQEERRENVERNARKLLTERHHVDEAELQVRQEHGVF